MILIADGGATKVEWSLAHRGKEIKRVFTKGASPYFSTKEEISSEIKNTLLPQLEEYKIDGVYFFGAGCNSAQKNRVIEDAIKENIDTQTIEIQSDLFGAARGLCGNQEGIACIMGTGSNSCHYNGKEIADHIQSLGYILGDEGSGAVLGRMFLNACLKNLLPQRIKEEFLTEYGLDTILILDKVYRQPMANRFLASLSPFILRHADDATVHSLITQTFKEFFTKNVMQYKYDYTNRPVHFTGSVAYYYREILARTAKDLNICIGQITRSPMDGLITYYS